MKSLSMPSTHLRASTIVRPQCARPRTLTVVSASTFDVHLRPYTLRKGDDLDSIASKRDITLLEILAMNPDLNAANAVAGKTILLPSGKLSKRDKEIIGGMGRGYRVYPVRSGETIDDIMSKRGITRAEMEEINPGLNLDALEANQLLKFPSNKFTVREREMLIGSRILPPEFFQAASNPFVVGIGALLAVCGVVLAWQKFYSDPDFLADE